MSYTKCQLKKQQKKTNTPVLTQASRCKKTKRQLPSLGCSSDSFLHPWHNDSPCGHFSGVICTTDFEIGRKPFRLVHFLPGP